MRAGGSIGDRCRREGGAAGRDGGVRRSRAALVRSRGCEELHLYDDRKGSGYYGYLCASRRACDNKKPISRKRLEEPFVAALNEEVFRPEILEAVYECTAKKGRI